MASDTKKRILDAALKVFAEKGYEATNVREIAEELGYTKSALYKHYKSKEEIWDALIDKLDIHYEKHFGSVDNLPPIPASGEELVQLVNKMTSFTINDEHIRMIRKTVMMEQFRGEKVRDLATKHFLSGTRILFMNIFDQMLEQGTLKKYDTAILAFELTAPITQLVHLCDRDPEKIPKVMRMIEVYTRHFVKVYCID